MSQTIVYMASIVRRQRGIWLANWSEDQYGTEEWDAFPTLAEAKRWCVEGCGGRLEWRQDEQGRAMHFGERQVIEEGDE